MRAYTDADGDVWTEGPDGLFRHGTLTPLSLRDLRSEFGPLTIEEGSHTVPPAKPSRAEALETATALVAKLGGLNPGERAGAVLLFAAFLVGGK